MFIIENQSVSFSTYRNAVSNAALVSEELLTSMRARIQSAYDAGEPIWMLAEEMKMRAKMTSLRSEKSPIDLAISIKRM